MISGPHAILDEDDVEALLKMFDWMLNREAFTSQHDLLTNHTRAYSLIQQMRNMVQVEDVD